jgi:uncharacterized protein (TIGR04551 family)
LVDVETLMTRLIVVFGAAALGLVPSIAAAQVPGQPGGGLPSGGPAGEDDEDKGDGVAEAAPKTPGLLPTTPTLPPPKGKRNRFELFELDGYFRLRGDYFKNFSLGFRDIPEQGGSPFPWALGCNLPTDPDDAGGRPCSDSVKTTNIRLRLEPRINVNETTSIHTQIDILDNYVLGSTVPEDGDVDEQQQIKIRRAWAEVQTPLGLLKFGRQPSHWGLGIFQNAGGEDPINGGYDWDSDYGDDVDRIMFSTLIPGTRFRGAIAVDYPRVFPTSDQVTDTAGRSPQPWDLDDNDDITRWVGMVSRMDSPSDFNDTLDRGKLGLNYGVYFTYETQGWNYNGDTTDEPIDPDRFVPRDATIYTPDLWLRLGWKKLLLEAEAVVSFGTLNEVADFSNEDDITIQTWGAVGRLSYRALDDKLRFGVEVGGASGDNTDNLVEGNIHLSGAQVGQADSKLTRFVFDPDYEVDLILFRELMGSVSNAIYTKPFMSYDLTRTIGLKVANVTSFAVRPVSTPGNATMYGTEFDADLGYTGSSFHAGIAYGVLFPLSAMNHPEDPSNSDDAFTYDDEVPGLEGNNVGDAGNAHTLQMRFVVKF